MVLVTVLAGCGRIGFGPDGVGAGDAGGDGRGDGDAAADAFASPGCGATAILTDDFDDGVIGPAWTAMTPHAWTVSEAEGVLRVAPPFSPALPDSAGYTQTATVGFAKTCAIAELVAVPTGSPLVYAFLRLGTAQKNVELVVEDGQLLGRFNNMGTTGTTGGGAYDPVADRFLRIRNTGSSYVFETGPSLASFTSHGLVGGGVVEPSPSTLQLGAGTEAGTTLVSGSAEFANVWFLGP